MNRYTGNVPQVSRNDDMSSLKLPGGCCAIIYEHGNYQGKSWKLCKDAPQSTISAASWNDKASSVKVVPIVTGIYLLYILYCI